MPSNLRKDLKSMNDIHKNSRLLFAFSLAACCLTLNAQEITANKTVDENGKVNISFNLVAKNESVTAPVFSVKFVGSVDGKKSFYLKSLNGDGATGIVIGSGKKTVAWDPSGNKIKSEDVDKVNINVETDDVTEEATYLVLNLKTHQMSYQKEEPSLKGGKNKTKEIWFRRIEPGNFLMGSTATELGREEDETQHNVSISQAFYLSIFETTQKQFQTIAGYNPSNYKGSTRPVDSVSYNMLRGDEEGSTWPQKTDHSVDKSYFDYEKTKVCDAFFYLLREKTGNSLVFDLPTEAQWEYACRAGESTSLNDGNNLTNIFVDANLNQLAWYDSFHYLWLENIKKWSAEEKKNRPRPVGSKSPNKWGLYDMHGNVEEYCLDYYKIDLGYYRTTEPVGAYKNDAFIDEYNRGPYRVSRGGSCFTDAKYCRSAARNCNLPDYSVSGHGFRIVLLPK